MGVSGAPPSTASEGGAGQIDTQSVERYYINITVAGSRCNKYPAKQHARKVAKALGASRGLIYLAGQPTLYDTDMPSLFRQRRYFYYLSGVNEADCYLTYDIEKDYLILYIPKSDLQQAIWYGPLMDVTEAGHRYDIDGARYVGSLVNDICSWINRDHGKSVMFILGPDEAPPRGDWMIKYVDSRRLQPSMDVCRGVKDHHEIDMIRRANVVSGLAHTTVLRQIGKMASEAEIAGLFLYTSMSHGAPNQSYGIIAASGENASILHYMKNNQPFGKRPLVCLDAGAEFECYASDVTRTFPLGADGEWPSDQSRDIYRVVERMQEECIGKIRKGVRFLDLHVHAHIVAIEELLKLGIFWGGTVDEIRQSGASKLFFPHGLGHHVGLDVHDVSGKSIMASRADDLHYFSSVMPAQTFSPCTFSASLLEENMVVTVEPGIYFNRLAIESARTKAYADYIDFDVVKKYAPVGGVRIEDDILITADGYENLTTAPKGDKALEIIRNSM